MFDGVTSRQQISLGGRSRRAGTENRSEFLKRQHKERDEREQKRIRDRAATKIQSVFRGWRQRRATGREHRAIFDKRCSDIAKVGKVLPQEQRAVFVFKALAPILRMFAFFFLAREDEDRLGKALELVSFSGSQAAAQNFLYLAFSNNESERRSFLCLLERLLVPMLRLNRLQEAASLLQLFKGVLYGREVSPNELEKRQAALSHLMRRTNLLAALSRNGMLLREASAAGNPILAADLVLLTCTGVAGTSGTQRLALCACLLSAPLIWEQLAQEPPEGPPNALLRHLADVLPDAPTADIDVAALTAILAENVQGSLRWVWLLGNLAIFVKRMVTSQHATLQALPSWLAWLSWVKAKAPAEAREGNGWQLQQAQVNSAGMARALLAQVDAQDTHQLLPSILDLYFPAATSAGSGSPGASEAQSCKPAPEILQALAFATPLTERLFPYLAHQLQSRGVDACLAAVFQSGIGSGIYDARLATRLLAFCMVYTVQLQSMYDQEFFSPVNPLSPQEIALIVPTLNRLAFESVTTWADRSTLLPASRSLREALCALVRVLYHRHLRKPIIPTEPGSGPKWWLIPGARELLRSAPVVDLGTDEAPAGDPMDEDEDEDEAPRPPPARARRLARLGGDSGAREVLEAVLDEVPHVLPFEDRVALLHNVILVDQDNREDTRAPWVRSELREHQIRRNYLVEDGYAAFSELLNEDALRAVFKVEFIAPDGQPESGIDGGGLFKEFMIHICRETFDPKYGLFTVTDDQTLYPSPGAFRIHPNAAELYRFLGKVIGKAIYEMFLLEAQFSRVFLNAILGRINEVDDVAALDKELYRGMLRLKENERVADLGLTFSINTSHLGHMEDVDLIPNGRNIAVTNENLTQYLHVVANFRTNVQIQRHTAAFVQGLQAVIPLAWLKMFDPYELNTLVSGSTSGFDVADLRRHTNYGGGYHEESPVVQWLWILLQDHFDVQDMGRFLMFVTSCSRPPLLGFRTLYPQFCIHRVPDATRLPTASTCANLLKLPHYTSFDMLRDKLTQAIRAESGFDLS